MNDKGHRMRYRRAFAEVDEKQAVIDALVAALEELIPMAGLAALAAPDRRIVRARAALSLARKGG